MKLEQIINNLVADFGVMYIKLHRFHWYVEGPQFLALHEKFEELYNEITVYLDEYAERLLAIGVSPIATLKQFLEMSDISEDGNEKKPEDILNTLIKDYTLIKDKLKKGIQLAEEENDYLTVDLFTRTIGQFEKHIWMLKKSIIK